MLNSQDSEQAVRNLLAETEQTEVPDRALDALPNTKKVLDFLCAGFQRSSKTALENMKFISVPDAEAPEPAEGTCNHGVSVQRYTTQEMHANFSIENEQRRIAMIASILQHPTFIQMAVDEAKGL